MRKSRKIFAVVMTLVMAFSMLFASVSVNAVTKPTKLSISVTNKTTYVGYTSKVSVKLSPKKANKTVIYKSSKKSVATVSSKGVVTGKAPGKATITVTAKYNKKLKKSFTITVKDPATDFNYINAEDLYKSIGTNKYVVVDARENVAGKYNASHVPTAVACSTSSIARDGAGYADGDGKAEDNYKDLVAKYGKTKKYAIVCNSGNAYANAAVPLLISNGVDPRNIFILGGDDRAVSSEGGMIAWRAHYPDFVVEYVDGKFQFNNGITVENLVKDMSGDKKLTVIDVRDTADYNKGHLEGVANTNLNTVPNGKEKMSIEEAMAALKPYVTANKNGLFAIICYSGQSYVDLSRSAFAELGVDERQVICVIGGNGAVTEAGLAVNPERKYVSPRFTYDNMNSSKYLIVDVRATSKIAETGSIPGSVFASVADGESSAVEAQRLANIANHNPSKQLIIVCNTGNALADKAVDYLWAAGVNNSRILTLGTIDSARGTEGGWAGWSKYAPKKFGNVLADPVKKTVTFKATVNGKMRSTKTMHYIVNKNGGAASKSLMTTSVTPQQVSAALQFVGGTAWDEEYSPAMGEGFTTVKAAVAKGLGNEEYSRVKVTVNGKTMAQVLKDYKNSDTVFANVYNPKTNGSSGCITCNTSCYFGVVADNNKKINNGYVANTNNIPKGGATVTVVMTVK